MILYQAKTKIVPFESHRGDKQERARETSGVRTEIDDTMRSLGSRYLHTTWVPHAVNGHVGDRLLAAMSALHVGLGGQNGCQFVFNHILIFLNFFYKV
jgi:hypothetical protein